MMTKTEGKQRDERTEVLAAVAAGLISRLPETTTPTSLIDSDPGARSSPQGVSAGPLLLTLHEHLQAAMNEIGDMM